MFTTNLKEQEQIILAQTSKNEEVLNKLAKSNCCILASPSLFETIF